MGTDGGELAPNLLGGGVVVRVNLGEQPACVGREHHQPDAAIFGALAACDEKPKGHAYLGYVEGERVSVAAPEAGWIEEVFVAEGETVAIGGLVATDRWTRLIAPLLRSVGRFTPAL